MSDETTDRDPPSKRSSSDKYRNPSSKSTKRNNNTSTTIDAKRFKHNESVVDRKTKKSTSPKDSLSTRNDKSQSAKSDKKKSSHNHSSSTSTKSHIGKSESSLKKTSSKSTGTSSTSSKYDAKRKKPTSFYEIVNASVISNHHALQEKLLNSNSDSSLDEKCLKKMNLDDELLQDILLEEKILETTTLVNNEVGKSDKTGDNKCHSSVSVLSPKNKSQKPPTPPSPLPLSRPPSPPSIPADVDQNKPLPPSLNIVNSVETAECSDMEISEVSVHTSENNSTSDVCEDREQDDQLYLQSLAKPVKIVTNERVGAMLPPNMMHPTFPAAFAPPPPPPFPHPPNFISVPPQPHNPYANFSYPPNVPMSGQPPQRGFQHNPMQPFVPSGSPAIGPVCHLPLAPTSNPTPHPHMMRGAAVEPSFPHINKNPNFSIPYNNYRTISQPHINYSAINRPNIPSISDPQFIINSNNRPVTTTSNLSFPNNPYGNGNTHVIHPIRCNPPQHTIVSIPQSSLHPIVAPPQNPLRPSVIPPQNPPHTIVTLPQNPPHPIVTLPQNPPHPIVTLPQNPSHPIVTPSQNLPPSSCCPIIINDSNCKEPMASSALENNMDLPRAATPPQKDVFDLLPTVTKDYLAQTYTDSTGKTVAADTIYRDYHKNWSGISKIWGERSLNSFEIICQVGEGTYGKVYRSKDLFRDEIVALKKIRNNFDHEGFPITAVREIKILRRLCHPNIVKLRDVISDKSDVSDFLSSPGAFYLVFEYMEHDLLGVLESCKVTFSVLQIQSLFKQLIEALNYCHNLNFLHRDLKCSNILLNNKGILKLADFGLARLYESEGRPYTNKVITLWYRPPELLFGQERYGPYVDIWSAGCILGELFTKRPILSGNKEIVQLDRIFKLCGSPTLKSWPDVIHLPLYQMMKPSVIYPRKLRSHFQFLPPDAIELMDQMLQLDPHKRITSKEVLQSNFLIDIDPLKIEPPKFPEDAHFHELLHKKRSKTKNSEHQKNEGGSNKTDVKDPPNSQNSFSRFNTGSSDYQRLQN